MFIDEKEVNPAVPTVDLTSLHSASLPLLEELPASPDAAAGHCIKSHAGETVQVKTPVTAYCFERTRFWNVSRLASSMRCLAL
ncbi:hypothetical protein M431DRAFT_512566 [Trichoderma harzianum CBS 226.95]|uniref:Uncharacterized protein n=1 Tax=Trichoderma harzianum CBS 226.95 TaxID=983964 RepID=A0A2T3ZYB2_TRIHA|nr:hypothetical protein M431DRAFT_512566 [Trichoderma harzianum CBS 226.95]PTB49789.1 hypothetical protein M431DRAFT_512566 [Trichoderma harzianum CBS 226.95]